MSCRSVACLPDPLFSHTHTPPLVAHAHPCRYCGSFASEQCPEGMVAVAGNTLRILSLERLGGVFNEQVPLPPTPPHPTSPCCCPCCPCCCPPLTLSFLPSFLLLLLLQVLPLSHTPRRAVVHPTSGLLVTIESDHNAYSNAEKEQLRAALAAEVQEGTAPLSHPATPLALLLLCGYSCPAPSCCIPYGRPACLLPWPGWRGGHGGGGG